MSTVPTNTNALARSPCRHTLAQGINASGNFMTGHPRILKSGPDTFFD
jgi:hypothetical protein